MKTLLPILLALVFPAAAFATGAVSISAGAATLQLRESPLPALNVPKTVTLTRTGDTTAAVDVTVTATPEALTPVSAAVAVLECRPDAVSAWKPLYWGGSLTATIPAGATAATFQLRSRDNNAYEVNVPGSLVISQLSGTATGVGSAQALNIQDDDTDISLSFSPTVFPEGNGTTPVLHHIEVTTSRPIAMMNPEPMFMTVFGGFSSERADEFSDYIVPFGAGPQGLLPYDTTFSVPIEIVPDIVWEGDETFFIQSMAWQTGWINVGMETMFTITDDEEPLVASISPIEATVTEGGAGTTTPMIFAITLNRPAPMLVAVGVSLSGTATRGSGDSDYTNNLFFEWVHIPEGQSEVIVVFTVNGDGSPEPDETVEVTISKLPVGMVVAKSPAIGTATALGMILNDDGQRTLVVGATSPASVEEGGSASLSLALSNTEGLSPFDGPSVNYTVNAPAGTTVSPSSGVVTFNGGNPQQVSFIVGNDGVPEPDAEVSITFSSPSGLVITQATVPLFTVKDNDSQRTLVVGATSPASVAEGGTASLSLSLAIAEGLFAESPSVNYTINAPAGTTVSPSSGVVTFIGGNPRQLYFTVGNDAVPELDAEVSITFSNPSGLVITQATVPLFTVVDNDRYTLSVSSPSVLEGNSGGSSVLAFNVSISMPAVNDLTFNYATAPGTAGAGDFTAASGTGTIPAGQTMAVVAVMVTGDAAVEPDEMLQLNVSSSDPLAATGSFSGTGTILHDDFLSPPTPEATLVTESAGSQETLAWFSVKMPAHPFPVTCTVRTRDGTAAAGSDYRALNGSLTFAQGETQKWVAVAVTPDSDTESAEQFFLDVQLPETGAVRSAACTIERLSISQFWRVFPGLYAVRFPSGLGQRYIVYESQSINGTWTPSSSILTGSGFPVTQTLFSEAPKSFYRVELAPPLPPGSAAVGP